MSAQEYCRQQVHVQHNDQGGDQPAKAGQPAGGDQFAHLGAAGGEHHQRHDGEGKLERQHHLAQDQKLPHTTAAVEQDHEDRRDDGKAPCDQAPRPRRDAQVDETFHHDLSGHGGGDSGVQASAQERHAEQDRRERRAEQRLQQQMRLVDLGDVVLPHGVEGSSGQDQDRCIDRQREHQGDGAVPSRQPQRLALRRADQGRRRGSARCPNAGTGYAA